MGETAKIELRRQREAPDHREEMAADVRRGLGSRPRTLPPKYFYDARGSRLFEQITELPEYYQTRTERALLDRISDDLVAGLRPRALVEYGSGSAEKTEILLHAMEEAGLLEGYAPVDVSPEPVREVAERLGDRHPGLRVVGIIGDFESELQLPFRDLPRLILFLGSTIGNLVWERAVGFLRRVSHEMNAGDGFLVGFDLVKDREILEAAYNDSEGVTAAFNRNVLRVLNRELEADFDLDAFRHHAFYDDEESRIEMHLVSERDQTVRIRALEMELEFEEGESIRTEQSHKYTRESAAELLSEAELEIERWDTDEREHFALALARTP